MIQMSLDARAGRGSVLDLEVKVGRRRVLDVFVQRGQLSLVLVERPGRSPLVHLSWARAVVR